jgi:alkylation response protein AidB-like acyl-CoA dehydrogenase
VALLVVFLPTQHLFDPVINLRLGFAFRRIVSLAFRKAWICPRLNFSASCTWMVDPQHAIRFNAAPAAQSDIILVMSPLSHNNNIHLTREQEELQNAAIAFAKSELTYDMVGGDRDEVFNRNAWNKCAAFGVLGMLVPREFGGTEHTISDLIAVLEGLGYGAKDQGLLFSMNAHLWSICAPLLRYGSDSQKHEYLPRLSAGEIIGANATTESTSGSDVFSMRTRAERKGEFYVLNGAKLFVTNAPISDLLLVYATVDQGLGPMGVSAFLIDRTCPGISIGKSQHKMGLRTSPMAEVVLEDCVVPACKRLGREGRGAGIFEYSMEWERGCILASTIGTMWRQLEDCLQYVRSRKQFGKRIGKFQSVASRLVDMKLRVDLCRFLVYRFAGLKEQNVPAMLEASMAKLYVSESCVASSLDAMRIYAGSGYMIEQELERDLRDAIGSISYSGTSDIQRNIIAKYLGV